MHSHSFRRAALVALFLLLLFPAGAVADRLADLWVTEVVPGQEEGSQDSLKWWYSARTRRYYLFLPAGAKAPDLRLWFAPAEAAMTVGGTAVHSGDQVGFLTPGGEVTIQMGGKSYPLSVMQSANIPALFITTASRSLKKINGSKEYEEEGSLRLLNADGTLGYNGKLTQLKLRGNATAALDKKPYQFKLEKSTDLCGMGKAKTWVLLADYRDNSLLRNRVTLALAKEVGLPYTSECQNVDVYINQEYYGTYLLCEKVEVGNSRVAIADLEEATEEVNDKPLKEYPAFGMKASKRGNYKGRSIPENPLDITGGYLMELDYDMRYKPETSGFVTNRGQAVVLKEPKDASRKQVEYIRGFMQGFENAIFAKDGNDPKTGKHYTEFVDRDSLVKKYMVEEIAKNLDGNRSSLFFFKPADSQSTLAFAGPAWDYDSAIGNYATQRNQRLIDPEGLITCKDAGEPWYWFPPLYRQADFVKAVKETYWKEFSPALMVLLGHTEGEPGGIRSIADYAQEITASAAMNFIRWPVFNLPSREVKTGKNYQENIDYITNFLEERKDFLDSEWSPE